MADLTGKSEQTPTDQYIDGAVPLRITSCRTCGIVFALPLKVYAERLDAGGSITCPNGHPMLLLESKIAAGDLLALSVRLVADLSQARHEVEAMRGRLIRATPSTPAADAAPLTPEELLRRVNMLVSRAAIRGDRDRRICTFCGKLYKGNTTFKKHLRNQHAPAIASLPPVAFF